jgi:hypothetical protein
LGLATDLCLQPLGPVFLKVLAAHEPKPLLLIFAPAGRKKFTPASGGTPPAGFCGVPP